MKKSFSLSKAFEDLEQITSWFQGEEFDLEEALKKYQKGMELVKHCEAQLKEVENRISEVKATRE